MALYAHSPTGLYFSFPPCDAHEKISSTCAKIPTILSTFFVGGLVEF